jgi:NADH:ubiquinone oxidoreductase subunit F (NADH-binding)
MTTAGAYRAVEDGSCPDCGAGYVKGEMLYSGRCAACRAGSANSHEVDRELGNNQEGNTNAFDSLSEKAKVNVRACMWVLMAQLYGQFAVLDLNHEWLELEATIKGGD